MTAYALASLRTPETVHPEVFDYMEHIQSTLDPYSGRFIVHGGEVDVREGAWDGDVVMIEFPGMAEARCWYESAAYRAIMPLRTDHLAGDVILVEGVEAGHDSARMAQGLRAAAGGQVPAGRD